MRDGLTRAWVRADFSNSVFTAPWQKIVHSMDDLAVSHHVLAQKIEVDVERPLRDFATRNREMHALPNMQTNLGTMAREIETAQKESDKLKKKGAKAAAGKVANATSDVESAMGQWSSQAPFIFESLQTADEMRLNHLRDLLTQFQTHETDQVERNRVIAEGCLNSLLNLETAEEIRTFAAQTIRGRPAIERQESRATTATKTTTENTFSPSRPTRAREDDVTRQRSKTPVGSKGTPGKHVI